MGKTFWSVLGSLAGGVVLIPLFSSITPRLRRTYAAAIMVTAILAPGIVAIASALLYLTPRETTINRSGTRALLFGTLTAVGAWLLIANLFRRHGHVARANPSEYALLCEQLDSLTAQLNGLRADVKGACAAKEARLHLEYACNVLQGSGGWGFDRRPVGLRWATAEGYVDVHQRLHRAEEALLELERSPERLRSGLAFDRSRIDGSNMTGVSALLARLDEIEAQLNAEPGALPLAASLLRDVRRSVNEFRDSRRAGPVRARNNLFGTVVFAGAVAYLVLAVALVGRIDKRAVYAAIAFYLVGATMGLFRQLAAASEADAQTEEDYGLAQVRLIETPLFSGIAAVGGVALMALLPVVTPTSGSHNVTSLRDIFDLDTNALGLAVAAAFGLTPTLLISRLTTVAEKYKDDLRSTRPAQERASTRQQQPPARST